MSVKELKNSLNLSWHETFHKCETEHIASALTAILALSALITCSVYAAQSGFSENIEWYYLGMGISGAVLLVDMLFIVDQVLDCLKPPQAVVPALTETPPHPKPKVPARPILANEIPKDCVKFLKNSEWAYLLDDE
jgi:hypothetical protein